MATTIWSMLCLSTKSTMSSVEPATLTPWMREPRLVGSSSVATMGMPGMSGSFEAMRPIASEPVSPAPTTSVRGRSHMRCVETSARLFWRMTRKIKRMPPMKNMSMKHETKNTRMGSRTSMIHKNTAPTRVDSTTASTIWMASSTLAYSQRLLYRWNNPNTATLMSARMPSMK